MDLSLDTLSLDEISYLDEITSLEKLTINDNPEYINLQNNIKEINEFINSNIHTKISKKLFELTTKLYNQNKVYLEKISFNPENYINCENLPDFNRDQIMYLLDSKKNIDQANIIFESLSSNYKLWNIKYIHNAIIYCKKAYELIILMI